uniref:Uncharacterized protein n=2 Tax=Oryza meridionalis TaxID=40149 RepID=A0A0E0EMJ8_9ORYZ
MPLMLVLPSFPCRESAAVDQFSLLVLQFGASEQFGTWRGGGAAAAAATAEGEGRWRSGRRRSKFWANGRRRLVVVGMSEK